MPVDLTALRGYSDERGNAIVYEGEHTTPVRIEFGGTGNRLVVHPQARIAELVVAFNCSNGYVEIGASSGVPPLRANMRVGEDARIVLGQNVSATTRVGFSAVEGTSIVVGDDVMFASEIQVRGDDGHPIFDVRTRRRVNPARDITIGNHVWVGWGAMILGGSEIGAGSVVGMRALVKGRFPNNVILGGMPARVLRRDIAWERPHLSLAKPYYKPTADAITTTGYWAATEDVVDASPHRVTVSSLRRRLKLRTRLRRLLSGAGSR